MSLVIRRAEPADVPDIFRLIVALAVHEREPDAVKVSEESLSEILFGDAPRAFVHVADLGGKVVGVALWYLTFSTWTGAPGLYLEDLFVAESARGSGAGGGLFRALAREAKARGCVRMDWAVMPGNEQARAFYARLGGHHSTGWQPWRIEGDALDRLAAA